MSLQSFGEQLKRHRQQEQVSLTAISAATRINVKFLEAIEEGRFSILPQTYIRAFLREYAHAVELDPDEIVKQYEQEIRHLEREREEPTTGPTASTSSMPEQRSKEPGTAARFGMRPFAVFSLIALAGLLLIYLANTDPQPTESISVTEVPFDQVVQESEATLSKHEQTHPPSSSKPVSTVGDSLTLEMVSTDSVWISMMIDKKASEEYLFPPNWKKTWRAKEEFLVTMGNAGGATFRLNGMELGMLGRKGLVVRNVPIRASLLYKQ